MRSEVSLCVAAQLVTFLGSLQCVPLLVYLLGLHPGGLEVPLACAAAAAVTLFWEKGIRTRATWLTLATLATSLSLGRAFVDLSSDGQTYHGQALRLLLDGWNPVWEHLPPETDCYDYLRDYSKWPWLAAAAIIRATGDLEAGKAPHFLLIAAVGALGYHVALRHGVSRTRAAVLGLLAAAHPIAWNQCWSYYVDGQLASEFTMLMLLAYEYARERDERLLVLLVPTVGLLVNVKLSGLVYMGVLAVAMLVAIPRRRLAVVGVGAFLLATCLWGVDPYLNGHFLRTLVGLGRSDSRGALRRMQETTQTPVHLVGRRRLTALALSLLGQCSNRWDPARGTFLGGELKIPGTVTMSEFACFENTDTRVAGFGPWSGLVFLTALVLAMPVSRPLGILFGGVAVTVLAAPDIWWARFVPQLWLVPTLVAATLIVKKRDRRAAFLVFLLVGNLGGVFGPYLYREWTGSARQREQLEQLSRILWPCRVCFGPANLNRLRFRQWGVPYVEVAALPPETPVLEGDVLTLRTQVEGMTLSSLPHPDSLRREDLQVYASFREISR